MLTWGAFHVVGGSAIEHAHFLESQQRLVEKLQLEVDAMGIESDRNGWNAKVFLYCSEVTCPQTGWSVPLLPTRIIHTGQRVVARLVPCPSEKRYDVDIVSGVNESEMNAATTGTIGRDGKYGEAFLIHEVNGSRFKTKISTLRGDYRDPTAALQIGFDSGVRPILHRPGMIFFRNVFIAFSGYEPANRVTVRNTSLGR